jgi:hypothetical protein
MINLLTGQPLQEAVDSLGRKSPIGALLSSQQWAGLPVELRDRAFFSAWVENERILAEAQRRIMQRVQMERDSIEQGGRVMERTRFISEMQDLLEGMGYQPDPEKEGTLQDLSSAGRLGLIWQMQLDQAHGHATWKTGMDPDILQAFPAQELIRGMERMERRDWPRIWAEHGGHFFGEPGPDYPLAEGRMIALKTDEIWTAISEFGTPWSPFAWGSGMVLRNVRRKEAVELGLIRGDETFEPNTVPFNSGLKASIRDFPKSSIQRLQDRFGDRVLVDAANGLIEWLTGGKAAA